MTIYISAKQIGKRKPGVAAGRYDLPEVPATLRELIRMMVMDGAEAFNRRIQQREPVQPVSAADIDSMSQVGKIAFGIPYGSRTADPEEAAETALKGFADGLVRIFVGDREIENLDAPLGLQDGDTVTIIRLVMLTGGFF